MPQAKKHSKPKKSPAKRVTAKVPKRGSLPANTARRSNSADPIFKLIEDWKAAEMGFSKAVSHFGVCEKRDLPENSAEVRAAEKGVDEAEDIVSDTLRRVCDTPPQTLSGTIALVRAMRPSHEDPNGDGLGWADGRTLNPFATLETALRWRGSTG